MKSGEPDISNQCIFGMSDNEHLILVKKEADKLRKKQALLKSKSAGFRDVNYNLKGFKELLGEFRKFESDALSIVAVYFIYGDMAHAYLDAKQYDDVLRYACALMHMAKAWNDEEGYLTGLTAYINVALATENLQLALIGFDELLEKDPIKMNKPKQKNVVYQGIKKSLDLQKNGEQSIPKIKMPALEEVGKYKKPLSYGYLTSRVMAANEMALREVAREMGVTKKTVQSMLGR